MSSKTKNKEAIYVELDVLLDTRIGTIARLNQDAATRVLSSGGYHTRQSDSFVGVDMEAYTKLYAERDTVTLAHSTVTGAIQWLKHLAGVMADQAIERPFNDGAKIVVNIYPYQLTGEEQEEMVRAIAAWMQGPVPVELTSIPTKDLTPWHCKSSYAMMMVYDHEKWMNTHSKAFEQHQLPEVTLFAPALYIREPTAEELEKAVKEAAHPMRALELLASPLVDLKLIEVKFFSILQK